MLSILSVIASLLLSLCKMLWYIAIPIMIYTLYLILSVFVVKKYFVKHGYKINKQISKTIKRTGLLHSLFIDLPYRYALDLVTKEENYFPFQGIHMFCGEQGSGKSIAMCEFMKHLQEKCPLAKTVTNFDYDSQDDELDTWHKLIDYTNGKQGVIVGIDEIQNWFMSGKNQLPPQMLEVCTQNRKNRRVIVCSAQVFTRVNKAIREQVTLVYRPFTFLGCFTVVRIDKPVYDSEGNVKSYKYRGIYHFVHKKEIRECYDTYKVIHTLGKDGFKETNILSNN